MSKKFDIGLIWAKCVNIWGQLGFIVGVINTLMIIGVFYTTTIYPVVHLPLWLYLLAVFGVVLVAIAFIVKYGISGWYRFFSNQSELSEVNKKISLIMKHFNIEEENGKK